MAICCCRLSPLPHQVPEKLTGAWRKRAIYSFIHPIDHCGAGTACADTEGRGTGTGRRRQAPGHPDYNLKGEERPASISGGPEVSGPRFQGQQSQEGVSGITWAVGVMGPPGGGESCPKGAFGCAELLRDFWPLDHGHGLLSRPEAEGQAREWSFLSGEM